MQYNLWIYYKFNDYNQKKIYSKLNVSANNQNFNNANNYNKNTWEVASFLRIKISRNQ